MAVIGLYCEISVIVMCLGLESVICLDNHTCRLCPLYALILFVIAYCLWRLRSEGLNLATTNFRGRSCSIHGGCSLGSVDTVIITRLRKRCVSTSVLFIVLFNYLINLD